MSAAHEETQYIGYDGTRMFMHAWIPEDERPRALVVAVHDLGGHGGDLETAGQFLAERGLALFAPDMRGFGHYTGTRGHVISFEEYVEDLQNIVMQVKDRFINRLTYLLGVSLGGLVVIKYVLAYPLVTDGMVLQCPMVALAHPMGRWERFVAWVLSLLNTKTPYPADMEGSAISGDPEVVRRLEEDSLRCDTLTPRFVTSMYRAMDEASRLADVIKQPVLLQQAGADSKVPVGKVREFYDRLSSPDKTWVLYEDHYHMLLGGSGTDRVLDDIYAWLERRLPR